MRIAVIGAGAAGLAALRRCNEAKAAETEPDDSRRITEVVCFERSDEIGGTWVYTEKTGTDRYGLPIHSSMYESLRTNLPKEVMGYPDFPISVDDSRSYLGRTEILRFLNRYCDHFQLRRDIRFRRNVELVEPIAAVGKGATTGGDAPSVKWSVRVRDLTKEGTFEDETFDAVMVCNGHYFEPNVPALKGRDIFKGRQLHSHDYRVPDTFEAKVVLVLGAGPSGMDLALEISSKAQLVILSHHSKDPIRTQFPANVVQKGDVAELTENGVVYTDGTSQAVDVVFYCTGYRYSFPFLAKSCNVRVESNMVTPLWKHLVSTENVTLGLVGLPYYVCAFSMFDLQVRFLLAFWTGKRSFPSKREMLDEEEREWTRKKNQGLERRHFHMMGPEQGRYYDDLANVAGTSPLPPVLTKLHNESSARFLDDLSHYRQDRYRIVDDRNYVQL